MNLHELSSARHIILDGLRLDSSLLRNTVLDLYLKNENKI